MKPPQFKVGDIVQSRFAPDQKWRVERVIGNPVAMIECRTLDSGVHCLGDVAAFDISEHQKDATA